MENFLELWPILIKEPEKTLKAKKGKLGDAAVTVVIASVLAGILAMIFGMLAGASSGDASGMIIGTGVGVVGGIMMMVMYVIGFFIASFLVYIVAKFLGGKGTFEGNAYTLSLVFSLMPLVMLAQGILNFIPCLGALAGLVISLYVLYLDVIAIKVANALSTGRAVAVIVILLVVAGIVGAILFAAMMAAVIASFMAASAAG